MFTTRSVQVFLCRNSVLLTGVEPVFILNAQWQFAYVAVVNFALNSTLIALHYLRRRVESLVMVVVSMLKSRSPL